METSGRYFFDYLFFSLTGANYLDAIFDDCETSRLQGDMCIADIRLVIISRSGNKIHKRRRENLQDFIGLTSTIQWRKMIIYIYLLRIEWIAANDYDEFPQRFLTVNVLYLVFYVGD